MRVALLLLLAGAASGCVTNIDCWMNGVCTNGACHCSKGWKGENCTQLNLQPAPVVGAYGYAPNVSSWGGLPTKIDGKWHLHAAEMTNGCGLSSWGKNSRVIHAVSDNMTGPYSRQDVTLGAWAHNPQLAVDNHTGTPTYLLFHIGTGTHSGSLENCGENTPEPVAPTVTSNVLHTASSPYGPWEPYNGLPGINNPSPFVFPNGTIVITGTSWNIYRADSWKGPWKKTPIVWSGDGGQGVWEDPFIFYDPVMSVWKMIAHVWPSYAPDQPACDHNYSLREAGFAYSFDGIHWVKSSTPPFDNKVQHTDGSTTALSTRERPKVIFAADGHTPIGLSNGVSANPEPWGCKDKPGVDWTYTLVVPIGE
eukprot:TRINITY_DN22122_c0_g1_i1.p1 TRINITY_DN22122_c0_g1~~TRINITY_DN22122_c0_g1_i1.p1  ORF type:complete len:365 (+),score=53.71 TRINITY_DN22122_c0_g1_i1:46-1140(+)